MKFSFIRSQHPRHSLAALCRLLGVSRSGYYAWRRRRPSRRSRRDKALREKIVRIWRRSGGIYGSPRVWAELKAEHGTSCSRKRVERLMRKLGLKGLGRSFKRRSLTRSDPRRKAAPDLLRRNFSANRPNQIWTADISYISTGQGFLYLATVMDLYSRRVVGWSMRSDLEAEIVIDALAMAIANRTPGPGLIHHSDRGSQYTSLAFGKTLAGSGLVASMGDRGTALDNAPAESFFATLKSELIRGHVYPTRDMARIAIFGFIEMFYNRRRRHSAIAYMSPNEYEREYWRGQEESKAA